MADKSAYVTYATVEQLNTEARVRANNDNAIINSFNNLLNDYTDYQVTVENNFSLKQDKTDNGLATTNKTVVGAINEVKSVNDSQATAISQNSKDITQIKSVNDNQTTAINLNTADITFIKANYAENGDIDGKQDKTDNGLTTTNKTVVGAINELNDNKTSNDDFASFQEIFIQYQNTMTNALNNKQNRTDNALTTKNKTVVGAINELKTNSFTWTTVGTIQDARTLNYNLVLNKKYRVVYHWESPSDTKSRIYKEFRWGGNNISLETFNNSFSVVSVIVISVLGSINSLELKALATGIILFNKSSITGNGRIIGIEEQN